MKNKSSIPFIRVSVIFTIVFIITELLFKKTAEPAFIENPSVALFLVSVLASLITFEAIKTADRALGKSKAELKALEEKSNDEAIGTRWQQLVQKLTKTKPITQEADILLDHNYDGIKELDNSLPPWWLYSFYISIVFAVLYLGYYLILGGETQTDEYNEQMEIARLEVEKYKRENPSTFDAGNITASDDTTLGKKLFKANCAACHMADGGGGIGPNLTDEYWILGGGIKNIYNTIAEGGRDGKGMIAWKNSLSPEKIQQLASYIISLENTTPKKPKEKEGEIWKGE